LSCFSNDPQKDGYEPFIGHGSEEIKVGSHYFKPLSRTIMQYVEHPEHKFDGDTGFLRESMSMLMVSFTLARKPIILMNRN
jgi:hypothetical protein